jgi:hypothetical protein
MKEIKKKRFIISGKLLTDGEMIRTEFIKRKKLKKNNKKK